MPGDRTLYNQAQDFEFRGLRVEDTDLGAISPYMAVSLDEITGPGCREVGRFGNREDENILF